jgi:ABC-type phosphate transport system permease subunit
MDLTSSRQVYTMMMGEIGSVSRYDDNLLAQILYVAYAFLVVILLSNVLIAIVTDSYEIIQNDRAAIVFWSNRLDFVAEMDGK